MSSPEAYRNSVYRRNGWSLLLCISFALLFGNVRLSSQGPVASSGTDFIANLPFLYLDTRAELLLTITAVEDATVTVYENESGRSTTRLLFAGESWHFRLPRLEISYPVQEEGRSRRSVRIRSSAPVTVQAAHDGDYVTDSWLIPPVRDLGLEHVVMSVWSRSTSGGVVTVAATEPNTTIRITPSVPTPRGGAPGFSYGITLDSGEVWQIVPTAPEFSDITGTRISSDRPVLVVGGHAGTDLVGRGAYNPMIEWHPPISFWGTEHIGRTLPQRREGIYKIVSSEDGTILWVNNSPVDTLDAGEHRRWYDPFPVYFRTSNPSLIAQFLDHTRDSTAKPQDGDPSMTFLQPTRVWTRSYRWTTLDLPDRINNSGGNSDWIPFRHYLMISADFSDGTYPVRLDGRDISDFLTSRISGTGYAIGWITIDSGTHELEADRPVALQSFGFNSYDAYAHPVGFPPPPMVDATGSVDSTCLEEYSTNLYIRNRSGDEVLIDSLLTGGENLQIDPVGTVIPAGRELRLTYVRRLASPGLVVDTVIVRVRNQRTGRVTVVESRVRVERILPSLSVVPTSISFPVATPDEPVTETTFEVINSGRLDVELSDLDLLPGFEIVSPSLPVTLRPGDSVIIRLGWRPATFPDSVRGSVLLHTAPCDVAMEIPAFAFSDVDREPGFSADTLYLFCGEESPEQTFRISNGTLYAATIDSIDLDEDLIGIDLPFDYQVESGESVTARVGWVDPPAGVTRRRVRIWVNGRPEPRPLDLVVVRRTMSYRFLTRKIELGEIDGCDPDDIRFTVQVVNDGDVALRDISLTYPTGVDITSDSALAGTSPGDTVTLIGRLSPARTGEFSETLTLTDSLCGRSESVTLTGVLRRGLLVPVEPVIFTEGALGCGFPTELPIRIVNRGDRAEDIVGLLPGGSFWSVDGSMFPLSVEPNDTVTLQLLVHPETVGSHLDTLRLLTAPCGDTLSILLRAETDSLRWMTADTGIVLDFLLPGISDTAITGVLNVGNRPLTIEEIGFSDSIPGLSVTLISPSRIVPAGGNVAFRVEYLSDDPTRTETTLLIIGPDCVDSLHIPVRIEPGTVDLYLSLDGGEGLIDDVVGVRFVTETPVTLPDPVALSLIVGFPRSGLYPEGTRGELEIESDSLVESDVTTRQLTVSYEGRPDSVRDTIGAIDLRLLLADRTDWQLSLSGGARMLDTTGVSVRLHLMSDSISISDLCRIDGNRLITLRAGIYLGPLKPNPTSSNVDISVFSSVEKKREGRLIVSNIIGVALYDFPIEILPGQNSYRLDLSDHPPGDYLVRVDAGEVRLTGHVVRE